MASFICVEDGCGGILERLKPIIPPAEEMRMGGVGKTRIIPMTADHPGWLKLLECPKCGRIEVDNSHRIPSTPTPTAP